MGGGVRLLLDSHSLLWWMADDPRLPASSRNAIRTGGNEVFVSAASAWEICTKHRIGKLPEAEPIASRFEAAIAGQNFHPLSVTMQHAQLAGSLHGVHKDPFDRMLIAQALVENLTLISNEARFDAFGVARLW